MKPYTYPCQPLTGEEFQDETFKTVRRLEYWVELNNHSNLLREISNVLDKNDPIERRDRDGRVAAILQPALNMALAARRSLRRGLALELQGVDPEDHWL